MRNKNTIHFCNGQAIFELTMGKTCAIDAGDLSAVSGYTWFAANRGKVCYAVANGILDGKKTMFYMHRIIIGAPKGQAVDHIDGNGLNNSRKNLRLATASQNMQNRGKPISRSTSKFKGVHMNFDKKGRPHKWCVQVKKKGMGVLTVGVFVDEVEAALAYDAAAKEVFGEFAKTNF